MADLIPLSSLISSPSAYSDRVVRSVHGIAGTANYFSKRLHEEDLTYTAHGFRQIPDLPVTKPTPEILFTLGGAPHKLRFSGVLDIRQFPNFLLVEYKANRPAVEKAHFIHPLNKIICIKGFCVILVE